MTGENTEARAAHYGDPGYEDALRAWEADQERFAAYSRPTDGYTQRELAAIYGFDYEDYEDDAEAAEAEEVNGRAEAVDDIPF